MTKIGYIGATLGALAGLYAVASLIDPATAVEAAKTVAEGATTAATTTEAVDPLSFMNALYAGAATLIGGTVGSYAENAVSGPKAYSAYPAAAKA